MKREDFDEDDIQGMLIAYLDEQMEPDERNEFEKLLDAHEDLRADLELQLRLDHPKRDGEDVVYDAQAIKAIMDRVFEKHSRQGHYWMAEQMELVLSCYGKVATQRVLDRTPQLCWQLCRQLPGKLEEAFGCVTDHDLEECLWESEHSRQRYEQLTQQLRDLTKAIDVVKSIG